MRVTLISSSGSLDAASAAAASGTHLFGDGSDGDVTVTTPITLTRDMYYGTLTLGAGGSIDTSGWRIFCKTKLVLTNAGADAIKALKNNGGNSTGVNAGAAATQQLIRTWQGSNAPPAGVAGGTTTGTNGNQNVTSGQFSGGRAGAAGAGGSGSSGAGGAAGTRNTSTYYIGIRTVTLIPWGVGTSGGSAVKGGSDGPSGGSGGGDTGQGGGSGAGGAGGGMVGIWAKKIERSSSNATVGIISALGGNGGNGGNAQSGNRGGGGAGGGGGGGSIYIVHGGLEGTTHTNAFDVSGGTGGNGGTGIGTGTAGAGGTGGDGGRVVVIDISTMTTTAFDGTVLTGSAPSGATGGAGATARTSL